MEYFKELLNSLQRGVLSPVYLFYGDEVYLRDLAVSRFKDFLAGGDNSGLNYDPVDGETATPADIAARAEIPPFLAGKRLVVVKNPPYFKLHPKKAVKEDPEGDEGLRAPGKLEPLLDYLKEPLETTCLIFNTSEPVDKRKKLFLAVQKSGRAIDFTLLKKEDLKQWLAQKARAAGKYFAAGAAEALLDAVGPSLQCLVSEIDKLFCYTAGREVINPEDVRMVCPPGLEESIFDVVDAMGNKRYGKALNGIKDMLASKEPSPKILAMISRQFRLLLQARDLLEQGFKARDVQTRLKLHPYVTQKIIGQCKNFSRDSLICSLISLAELDAAVKTGRREFYPAIETFLLEMK
ncbi:MAG: DNA polymerase III subunit delta [Desulfotomaculaceae bacterium]|nr:DNA polymerase III subunit delta [Desulfotomaculaceae bacterium]